MTKVLRKIAIVLSISLILSIDGMASDKPAPKQPQPKPKTKIVCKTILQKPQLGPWTIVNQIPVKICKEVPIADTEK